MILLVGHCLRFDPRYDQAKRPSSAASWARSRRSTRAGLEHRGGPGPPPRALLAPALPRRSRLRRDALAPGERGGAGHGRSKWGLLREQGFPVEDANCALLRFASGALGIAELNWILPRGFPAAGDHRLDWWEARAPGDRLLETGLRRADGQRAVQVDTTSAPLGARPRRGHVLLRAAALRRLRAGPAQPAVTPGDAVQPSGSRCRRAGGRRQRGRRYALRASEPPTSPGTFSRTAMSSTVKAKPSTCLASPHTLWR